MEYPQDILNRVRGALEEYRYAHALNGRRRTWERVAEELFDDFLSDTPLDGTKDAIKALAEALRRFAGGSQVLSDERRAAVRSFLLKKQILTEADFQSAPGIAPLVRQLRDFLGADEELDRPASDLLAGTYIATRQTRGNRHEVSVLTITPGGGTITVEDRIHSVPALPPTLTREGIRRYVKATGAATVRHDGVLLGTRDGQLCIFARDRALSAAGIYLVLHREGDTGRNDTRHILLLKSADFGASQPRRKAHGIRKAGDNEGESLSIFVTDSLWRYSRSEER